MQYINTKIAKGIIMSFCLFLSPALHAQFKVVGYLTNWGSFVSDAQKIDYSRVTHVNIAFINPNTKGVLSPVANLATVTQIIHNNNAVVVASLGGATANANTWATYTSTANRTNFISQIVKFTKNYNLDGIDVDLEGNLITASYNSFVQELADSLHAQNKLITTAIATWQGNQLTDLTLAKYDLINVMSYDYYGTWSGPGQHSPYSGAENELVYWTQTRGLAKEKVILGVPFYGYSWAQSGKESLPYSEILSYYPDAAHKDSINTSDGVIYFNGKETIKEKTVLALSKGGGVMIWTLQNDVPVTDSNSLLKAIGDIIQSTIKNIAPLGNITHPLSDTTIHEGDSLWISADASDEDGHVTKVAFFADKTKISESTAPPYQANWKNIGPGKYRLYAKVTDNAYANIKTDTVIVTVLPSTVRKPFGGAVWPIPGKIEAENFDFGTNLGYYDADAVNAGGEYRSGPVDIEACTDSLGGYDIGWTSNNEWLKYSVKVVKDTTYMLKLRVATQSGGGQFHIEKNDTNITGPITVPATGGWQIWKTITIDKLKFTSNDTVVKVVFDMGGFNLNYLNFKYTSSTLETGLDDGILNSVHDIALYPNPCENMLHAQYELKTNTETSLLVLDVLGRIVYEQKRKQNAGVQTEIINTGGFAKGVYQLLINGQAQKFIVK